MVRPGVPARCGRALSAAATRGDERRHGERGGDEPRRGGLAARRRHLPRAPADVPARAVPDDVSEDLVTHTNDPTRAPPGRLVLSPRPGARATDTPCATAATTAR